MIFLALIFLNCFLKANGGVDDSDSSDRQVNLQYSSFNCLNFNSWSDMNSMVNRTILEDGVQFASSATLKPKRPLVLTGEVNIGSLIERSFISEIRHVEFNPARLKIHVYIYRIHKISISSWEVNYFNQFASLYILYSLADIYVGEKPLRDFNCTADLLAKSEPAASTFFNFREVQFATNVRFPRDEVCVFIFSTLVYLRSPCTVK
jgi:hypothetical protein